MRGCANPRHLTARRRRSLGYLGYPPHLGYNYEDEIYPIESLDAGWEISRNYLVFIFLLCYQASREVRQRPVRGDEVPQPGAVDGVCWVPGGPGPAVRLRAAVPQRILQPPTQEHGRLLCLLQRTRLGAIKTAFNSNYSVLSLTLLSSQMWKIKCVSEFQFY